MTCGFRRLDLGLFSGALPQKPNVLVNGSTHQFRNGQPRLLGEPFEFLMLALCDRPIHPPHGFLIIQNPFARYHVYTR